MAASCRTGRKDRAQLNDATLSRGPIAKTGAAFRSVRKRFTARHTASTYAVAILSAMGITPAGRPLGAPEARIASCRVQTVASASRRDADETLAVG